MNRTIILATMLLLLPLLSVDALAQRKTDIITLYNGDQVTGEIKGLLSGIMELSTDSMDTIRIEWQDIASIESKYNYEVRLSDTSRLFGSIHQAGRAGQLRLTSVDGEHDLEWIEVVELRPIEDSWTERLDIYLSAGYSYTKASSVANTTLNTDISYGDANTDNALTARHSQTQTDEDVSRSSRVNFTRSVWTDRSRDFRSTWGSYESNDELGLEHRYAAGAGLGRFIIDTHKMRWTANLGLQLLTEKNETGGESQAVEGALTSDYQMWRLNTPELDFKFTFHMYPNLSDTGRLRGDTDIRLRWEIVEDLYWDVTAYGTFDNEAESEIVWDYGLTTGLGWKF